jgi:hypothetical protein
MRLIEKVKQEVQKSRSADLWNDTCELKIKPLGYQEEIVKERRYREERTSLIGENFMPNKYPDETRKHLLIESQLPQLPPQDELPRGLIQPYGSVNL